MINYFTEDQIEKLKDMNVIERTKLIVSVVFENRVDKAGEPYINHLNAVATYFKDEDEIVTALLHDIVEDTEVTIGDLKNLNYNNNVLEAIRLLTRTDESYEEYINNLIESDSIIAKRVKISDLLNNMNLNRLANVTEKDFDRIRNKYVKTYIKVLDSIEKELLR